MHPDKENTLAIIGSGATTIYLLKHILDNVEAISLCIGKIVILEKSAVLGTGMPYSPLMTDKYNMANISSEEIPDLGLSFADWLRELSDADLASFDILRDNISDSVVYSRLALGAYFQNRFHLLIAKLHTAGLGVEALAEEEIIDVQPHGESFTLNSLSKNNFEVDKVIFATGHIWKEEDHPEVGYYASPWPISKILPEGDVFYDFPIGILGASLSAFDVVTSLAHRHGTFTNQNGNLIFKPVKDAPNFKLVLHDSNGWLPHLQYEQKKAMRQIYRHISKKELLNKLDAKGFLRLETFFDEVCRPALLKAFKADGLEMIAERLRSRDFGLEQFVELMSASHEYSNAFEGMKLEMITAKNSLDNHKPIHWKEVVDDLMYCLNYHAELMPAEDHICFHKMVMPFLLNVIAALPLSSAKIMLALYDAGKLDLMSGNVCINENEIDKSVTHITVTQGSDSTDIAYKIFICCGGQKQIELQDYPFQGLFNHGLIRAAKAPFADYIGFEKHHSVDSERISTEAGEYLYSVGGVDVDSCYNMIGNAGNSQGKLFDVTFTHTVGRRPYSYGLQACNATAHIMVKNWVAELRKNMSARERNEAEL